MADTPSGSGDSSPARAPGGQPGRHLQFQRPRSDTDSDISPVQAPSPARTHPVTSAEVLALMQSRHRSAQTQQQIGAAEPEPDALPDPNARKQSYSHRFSPLAIAMTDARAAIEGVSRSSVLEEFLIQYGWGVPEDPDLVRDRQRELLTWFVTQTDGASPPDRAGPRLACDALPPHLLDLLRARARRRGLSPAELLTELLGDE